MDTTDVNDLIKLFKTMSIKDGGLDDDVDDIWMNLDFSEPNTPDTPDCSVSIDTSEAESLMDSANSKRDKSARVFDTSHLILEKKPRNIVEDTQKEPTMINNKEFIEACYSLVNNKSIYVQASVEAEEILDEFLHACPDSMLEIKFQEACHELSANYPHYFNHLKKKYIFRYYSLTERAICKKKVINYYKRFSKTLLGAYFPQLSGAPNEEDSDFLKACNHFKTHYSETFTFLMNRHNFTQVVVDEQRSEENKLAFITAASHNAEYLRSLDNLFGNSNL